MKKRRKPIVMNASYLSGSVLQFSKKRIVAVYGIMRIGIVNDIDAIQGIITPSTPTLGST